MIDLLSFRLYSVSLYGGNATVLDIGKYAGQTIFSIAVLNEECGNTGTEE